MTVAGQIPTKGQTVTGPKTDAPKKAPAKKAPSKAVAKVTKPEEKSDFTPAKAKAHTEKIKKGATTTFEQIEEAYKGRIWLALAHKSWDEYCDKEFDGVPLALPREKKKQAIASLASSGMSSRAIAAATGVSQRTAARGAAEVITDPKPTESNGSEVIDAEVIDGLDEFASDSTESEGRKVLGQDGREINVSNIGKQPVVVNVVSAARNISKELDGVRIRLEGLLDREDYEENKVAVQGTLEQSVGDFLDALAEDFGDIVRERTASLHELEAEPV